MNDAFWGGMSTWQRPRFVELNLSAEIGGYYEEHDFPLFLRPRRRSRRRIPGR